MNKKKYSQLIFLILFLSLSFQAFPKGINKVLQTNVWSMNQSSDTLLQEGLAGSFFGKQGEWFILAGGANFPHGKPWEGGAKTFSNKVFVFAENTDSQFNLITTTNNLPFAIAEGAFVSTPKGLLCMGGQTKEGLSNKTFVISYNDEQVTVEMYPDLPIAVKNATATIINNRVYLLGGQTKEGQSLNQFLMFNLSQPEKGWQHLPNFPFPISASTMTAQQDGEEVSLFVFGGRAIDNVNNVNNFYSSVFTFKPLQGKWIRKKDIHLNDGQSLSLSMHVAASIGASHIALIGGDDGTIFNQVEKAINQGDMNKRDSLWINHPGFNDKILFYNTITDTWFELNNPRKTPSAVASVFSDGKQIYIAGGEICPGIRNPEIVKLTATAESSFGYGFKPHFYPKHERPRRGCNEKKLEEIDFFARYNKF